MPETYACFEKVVGLTRTTCDCYGEIPEGADKSASGLYVDELPGISLKKIFAAASCEADGYTILSRAYDHALSKVKGDVLAGVLTRTRLRAVPVRQHLGDSSKATQPKSLNTAYTGMRVVLADMVGGKAKVHRIGTRMKFSGNLTLYVYAEDSDVAIHTQTIACNPNSDVWTDYTGPELRMAANGSENRSYWFLFQPSNGQEACNVRMCCSGCGCKDMWGHDQSDFESRVTVNGKAWTQWARAGGVSGSLTAERKNWAFSNETNGLMLDMEFGCEAQSTLCTGTPVYDGSDPVQYTIAHAVWYQAGMYIMDYVSGGSAVDREALLGDVSVGKIRQQYSGYYAKNIAFIVDVLTARPTPGNPRSGVNTYSDCLLCSSEGQPYVKTIFA